MTVEEAIDKIHAPKGVTSVISGLLSGDYSVLNDQKGIEASFEKAEEMVAGYEKKLKECKSDWSYWSILGDLEYWKAVKNILEAGKLNNGVLADVAAPDLKNGVVMDLIGKVTSFGEEVLKQTKAIAKDPPPSKKMITFNHQFIIYPNEQGWETIRQIIQSMYSEMTPEEVEKEVESKKSQGGFKEQLHCIVEDYSRVLRGGLASYEITLVDE